MSGEDRRNLQAAAARVKVLAKTVVSNILEIGRELLAAKTKLGHRHFGPWLKFEGLNERSAQRYMQAAQWAEGKSDTVSVLEPTAVYMLSSPSTPEWVSEEVFRRIAGGEQMQTSQVRVLVSEAKDKAKAKRRAAEAKPPEGHDVGVSQLGPDSRCVMDVRARIEEFLRAAPTTEERASMFCRLRQVIDDLQAMGRKRGAVTQMVEIEPPTPVADDAVAALGAPAEPPPTPTPATAVDDIPSFLRRPPSRISSASKNPSPCTDIAVRSQSVGGEA